MPPTSVTEYRINVLCYDMVCVVEWKGEVTSPPHPHYTIFFLHSI